MATTDVGTIQLIAIIDTSKYKKGAKEVEKTNDDMEKSADSVTRTNKKQSSSFANLARKGFKVATVAALGFGTAVAAMTLKGGISRALNIEDAQAKLRGLGHDTKSVKKIMDNALASVKGTAFGLDAAATTAANAVASGIRPGRQLEQVLKTVANTASLAGRDMSELGAIFNKVAASNKVQMDVINQLHDAGVPALSLLAQEIGKTAEETAKMASRGEIDFATFERAMRKGVGDAAVEMGKTTRGSLANMQAAFSRAGAIIADKILPHVRDSIQGITGWVDDVAKKIPGAIDAIIGEFQRIRDGISGVMDNAGSGDFGNVGESIGSSIANGINAGIKGLSITMETIRSWFSGIDWGKLGIDIGRQSVAFLVGFFIGLADFDIGAAWNTLAENWLIALLGIMGIIFAPSKLVAPLGKILSKIPFGKTIIKYILKPIRSLGNGIRSAVSDVIGGAFNKLGDSVGSKIGTIFKTIGQIMIAPIKIALREIENFIRMLPLTIQQVFTGVINTIKASGALLWGIAKTVFGTFIKVIRSVLSPITGFFRGLFGGIWNNIKGIFSGTGEFFSVIFIRARLLIERAFGGIVNWFGGRWVAIKNVFSGTGKWFLDSFRGAWNNIKSVFSGIGKWFSNRWNDITKSFRGFGEKIGNAMGNAMKTAINAIMKGIEKSINGAVDVLNGAINLIDKITPGSLSRIDKISLPRLAEGGIIPATPGGRLAVVGEGGEDEAVIPLSKLDKILANERSKGDSTSGGANIQVSLNMSGIMTRSKADERSIAKQLIESINQELRSKGITEIGGGALRGMA